MPMHVKSRLLQRNTINKYGARCHTSAQTNDRKIHDIINVNEARRITNVNTAVNTVIALAVPIATKSGRSTQ